MGEGHADQLGELRGRRQLDLEDAGAELGDLAGALDRPVLLGELVGRADDLGPDDLGEGVRDRRHGRQLGGLDDEAAGLLLLRGQGEDEEAGQDET